MAELAKINLNGTEYELKAKNSDKLGGQTPDYYINYNNFTNTPTIGKGTLTIQKNGSNVATFGANSTSNVTANISVPTTLEGLSGNLSTYRLYEPSLVNGVTPTSQGIIDITSADRLAFLPADQIIIEQSTDGGTTWVSAGYNDTQKRQLFSGLENGNISIPRNSSGKKSCNCMVRVTITGMKYNVPDGTAETNKYNYWNSTYVKSVERYFNPNLCTLWLNSNADRIQTTVLMATGANPNSWVTNRVANGCSGWSGRSTISLGGSVFGGSTGQTGNYWNYRFIFRTQASDESFDDSKLSTSYATTAQNIYGIRLYSSNAWTIPSNMVRNGHLYTWDIDQNATFPSLVKAPSFYEGGTALSSKYAAANHNHNSSYLSLSGGNISGHIYLTGSNASSSTGNTSQVVFGTANNQHIVLSANDKALIINPTTSNTANQIVLYLNKQSVFPSGITSNGTINASTLQENGTSLVNKYLGINAKAADSSKLNNQEASYYATAASVTTNTNNIATNTSNINKIINGGQAVNSAVYDEQGNKINTTYATKTEATTASKKTSSANSTSKLFLIGATSQSADASTTYSNSKCYVGTDNCLYSNSTKVLTSHAYRPIQVNGSSLLTSGDLATLNFQAGTNISLSGSGGTITINSTASGGSGANSFAIIEEEAYLMCGSSSSTATSFNFYTGANEYMLEISVGSQNTNMVIGAITYNVSNTILIHTIADDYWGYTSFIYNSNGTVSFVHHNSAIIKFYDNGNGTGEVWITYLER